MHIFGLDKEDIITFLVSQRIVIDIYIREINKVDALIQDIFIFINKF